MRYRAAVIGCGSIGADIPQNALAPGIYSHAAGYRACPDTDLMAVCDVDLGRAQECARRWSVPQALTEPSALLNAVDPEIVSVCTPDETHVDLLRAILRHRSVKAILIEKPVGTALADAREVVSEAEARRVVLAVNYSRRFAPSYQELMAAIRNGVVGSVRSVVGHYTKGLVHNGTHWLDLARSLVGEIRGVQAWDRLHEPSADPTLDVDLTFDSGARGRLIGLDARDHSIMEMDIVGSEGRIRAVDAGSTIEYYRVGESPRFLGYRELALTRRVTGALDDILLHAVSDVAAALREGRAPACTGQDGLAALAIAFSAREAAATGSAVAIG